MFSLKSKDKTISFKITFSKANKFSVENCKENESLMTVIPSKIMSNDSGEFLVKILQFFQFTDGEKLSVENIEDFLDEVFENSEIGMVDVYEMILKEFDYSGVFKKGMGLTLANKIDKVMQEMMTEMEKETDPTTKK